MRLFTAILFPETVKERLLRVQALLRAHGSGNFTDPDNLHVTLVFLGETQQKYEAIQAMEQTESSPFTLQFSAPGNFGDLQWAGIEPSPALSALQNQLAQHLSKQGFVPESREFIPHVTLCRNYQPTGDVPLVEIKAILQQTFFTAEHISLMESTRDNGKLVYRQRFQKKLS